MSAGSDCPARDGDSNEGTVGIVGRRGHGRLLGFARRHHRLLSRSSKGGRNAAWRRASLHLARNRPEIWGNRGRSGCSGSRKRCGHAGGRVCREGEFRRCRRQGRHAGRCRGLQRCAPVGCRCPSRIHTERITARSHLASGRSNVASQWRRTGRAVWDSAALCLGNGDQPKGDDGTQREHAKENGFHQSSSPDGLTGRPSQC